MSAAATPKQTRKEAAAKEAEFIKAVMKERQETGWYEMSFVGQEDGRHKEYWKPATVKDGDGAPMARWWLGMIYAMQFAAYLRDNVAGNFAQHSDLPNLVEAMTGKELGDTERAFFETLAEIIGGDESCFVCSQTTSFMTRPHTDNTPER
jgi:hypothetical protein